jgi:hypothetical protein
MNGKSLRLTLATGLLIVGLTFCVYALLGESLTDIVSESAFRFIIGVEFAITGLIVGYTKM